LTSDLVSDPRLQEVISAVLSQFSPLLHYPKLSSTSSSQPLGPLCDEALDLESAEAAHIAEGERLRQARILRDSAQKAATERALAEQLASKRAREEQLKSELMELESAEAAAVEEFARHQALAAARRLALSQHYGDLHKLTSTVSISPKSDPGMTHPSLPFPSQPLPPHLSKLASPSPPTTQSSSFTRVGVATPGTAAPMNVATPPFGLPRPGEASQE